MVSYIRNRDSDVATGQGWVILVDLNGFAGRDAVGLAIALLCRMRLVIPVVLASTLAACGGTDFDGAYVGDISRTDIRTNTSTTVNEKWTIDGAKLTRVRSGTTCELTLEAGSCTEGCFNQVITGGECTFGGELFRLETGLIESGNVSDKVYQISTLWTVTGVGGARIAALTESGMISKQ